MSGPSSSAAPSAGTQWPVVLVAVAAGIVVALHLGKVPPALPVLRQSLDLDMVQGGFLVSVFNLLGMVVAILVGAAADRLGRGRLVTAGFLALAAGGGLGALSESYTPLLISRFVEGVGFIAVVVALPAVVLAAASERDRALALGLWAIFMPAGMALALVLAPPLLAGAGWQGLWGVVAVLCLVALVAVHRAIARVTLPPAPRGHPARVVLEVGARSGLLLLAASFGAYAFQWITVMVWLPTFLSEGLGIGAAGAALLTAGVVSVNVVGNLVSGWLQRHGLPPWMLICVGCLGMGLADGGIFGTGLPDGLRLALCFVFSLTGGVIPACLFSGVPRHVPTMGHLGAANGLLMQGSNIGQFVGPPIIALAVSGGLGADWSKAAAPLALGAVLAAVTGVLGTRKRG